MATHRTSRRQVLLLGLAGAASAVLGAAYTARRLIADDDTVATTRASTSTTTPPATDPSTTSTAGSSPTTAEPATSTTAEPTTTTTEPTVVASEVEVICRPSWGARPAAAGRTHVIDQITVHHTAALLRDNRQSPARIRGYQRFHQDDKGWIDIAYHYVIDANGNIFEARDPTYAGDTATDYDPATHFLAVCDGNFDQQAIPEAQLDGLARILAYAVDRFDVPIERIAGHRDHASTACPGASLYAELQSGSLQSRVRAYVEAGPLGIRDLCGAEGDARVDAIESGTA